MKRRPCRAFPSGCCGCPSTILERLDALGLRTIGDVLQLPRETLASRFGLILPQRLDQALGRRPESVRRRAAARALAVVREWEVPLENRLAVALVCRQMLRTLLSDGESSRRGSSGTGRRTAYRGRRPSNWKIRLVEPSRDERHLAQLVDLQLERCTWSRRRRRHSMDRASARAVCAQVQHDWFADDASSRTPPGRSSPWSIGSVAAWGMTRCCGWKSFPTHSPSTRSSLCPGRRPGRPGPMSSALPPEQSRCRPFRLLGVPQPIAVVSVVPDGPPIRVTWRNAEIAAWCAAGDRSGSRRAGGVRRTSSATITAPSGRTVRTPGSFAIGAAAVGFSTASSSDESCRNNSTPSFMPRRRSRISPPRTAPPVRYVELHCKTNFSFLEGASHPDELVNQAAMLGYAGLAITDRNSVAGVVRAHVAAEEDRPQAHHRGRSHAGRCRPRVALGDEPAKGTGGSVACLTRGRRLAPKGECHLTFADVAEHSERPPRRGYCRLRPADLSSDLPRWREVFPDRTYAVAELHRGPCDARRLGQWQRAARAARVPLVAAGDVHYHDANRRYPPGRADGRSTQDDRRRAGRRRAFPMANDGCGRWTS